MIIRYTVHGQTRGLIEDAARNRLADFLDLEPGDKIPGHRIDIEVSPLQMSGHGDVVIWQGEVEVIIRDAPTQSNAEQTGPRSFGETLAEFRERMEAWRTEHAPPSPTLQVADDPDEDDASPEEDTEDPPGAWIDRSTAEQIHAEAMERERERNRESLNRAVRLADRRAAREAKPDDG